MSNLTSIPAAPRFEDTPYVKRLLQTEFTIKGKIDQDGQSLYIDVLINGENCIRQFVLNGSTQELEQLQRAVDDLVATRQDQDEDDCKKDEPVERDDTDDRLDAEFERRSDELAKKARG